MKTMISEYGKIIILFIATGGLIFYLFYAGTGGFRKSLPTPQAAYGKEDSQELVKKIQDRTNPTLTFSKNKLVAGQTYDFTNKTQMGITAENADGQPLDVKIIYITNQENAPFTEDQFTHLTVSSGFYRVKYRVEETYKDVVYATQKTCLFVVE